MKQYWQHKQPQGKLIAIIAKSDRAYVGSIVSEIDRSTSQGKILSLFVLPQYRQQGIGTQLMRSLEQYLQTISCRQVVLNYQATPITKLALLPILARLNWRSPETTFILVKTDLIKIAQAPWLYKYPLPDSFTVFPWTELTKSEKAELAQR